MANQPFDIKKNLPVIFVIILVVILPLLGKLVGLLIDFYWFQELQLFQIFKTTLVTKITVGIAIGLAAFLFIYSNILLATNISKRSPSYPLISDLGMIQLFRIPKIEKLILLAATIVLSFFIATWASAAWDLFLKFKNVVPFNVADPLFNKDISFYVFKLPFYKSIYFICTFLLIVSLFASALIYTIHQNIGFTFNKINIPRGVKAHIFILLGFLFLSLYFYFQFAIYSIVNEPGSIVNGGGYAQVHVSLPILNVLKYLSIIGGVLVWISIVSKSITLAIGTAVILFLGVVVNKISTQIVQRFIVAPNELSKETPFINWSIANTRKAYDLEKIESRHFVPSNQLNAELLQKNNMTIKNVRLWDHAPLLTTYSQLQEIRTYYEFLDVDNDRYMINGKNQQVMLSPRELVPSSLPSRSWINEHLTYTHGYGVCLGPVNNVTAEGLPEFFIQNIPPTSNVNINIKRPEIYYGEADAGYAIVNTKSKEFDYPSGNENIYTTYAGKGGIELGSILKRTFFAMHLRELKILLGTDISSKSKILLNREIRPRIQKAVPFLIYDNDPYMMISEEGRLLWVIDGYTTTSHYPYSAKLSGLGNYIRNSVKAVIDAYDGNITLYIWDETDPIIQTYAKSFPGIFKSKDQMPQDQRNHMRYPQTFFTVQARIYAIYHMTDPQVFYNKEDIWRIPESYIEGQNATMKPYYTIMKLAGVGDREEFILMVPFSPAKKENMIAWLAARCDDPNYGKLLVFDFPKQKLVYGPSQIESRINQDPEISKQLTLWNQGGSRVIRGSLLVIPVEQSLVYIQPLYLSSQNGGVPELKRVIVAFENSIAMEDNLERSLYRIFGAQEQRFESSEDTTQTTPTITGDKSEIVQQLIIQAERQFRRSQEEIKNGNWSGYGDAMKNLERTLNELVAKSK